MEERNNKYPKVSKCPGSGQLRLWFFSGCTNVPAFTGLVPRPTKLFYDEFPALSGQGSGMLSPGGNLELRALRDRGVIRQIMSWEGRVQSAGQKGLWKVPLSAKRGIYPDFWVTQGTAYPHCHIEPLWVVAEQQLEIKHNQFEESSCCLSARGEVLPRGRCLGAGLGQLPALGTTLCCDTPCMMAFAIRGAAEAPISWEWMEQGRKIPAAIHVLAGGTGLVQNSCFHHLKSIVYRENFGEIYLPFISFWGKVCIPNLTSSTGGRRVIPKSSAMQKFRKNGGKKKIHQSQRTLHGADMGG